MAAEFQLAILTPERTVFEGAVEYVQVPGTEGYLGVLANHAALVTALAEGTMTVRKSGGEEARWTVAGGFFEVSDNQATVLADALSEATAARAG
jgi:F-type H+-transporting ATPase subunit epsilon